MMTKDEFDNLVESNNLKFRSDNKHHIDRLTTMINSEIESYISNFKYIPQEGNLKIDIKNLESIPEDLLHGLIVCIVENLSDNGWTVKSYAVFTTGFLIILEL